MPTSTLIKSERMFKLKTKLFAIIFSLILIFALCSTASATQYIFDENGVFIGEIEETEAAASGYVFDENGVVIAEPEETTAMFVFDENGVVIQDNSAEIEYDDVLGEYYQSYPVTESVNNDGLIIALAAAAAVFAVATVVLAVLLCRKRKK